MLKFVSSLPFFVLAFILTAAQPSFAAGGGYEGLIAPAPDESATGSTSNEPEYVPPISTVSPAPKHATSSPSSTLRPGSSDTPSRDIRLLSRIHGGTGGAEAVKAPPMDYSKVRQRLIDGKTVTEYTAEKNINYLLSSVNEKKLSRKEREQRIQHSLSTLAQIQQGLVTRQQVSDSSYQKMGYNDQYIRSEKAGIAAALTRVNQAVETLKAQ